VGVEKDRGQTMIQKIEILQKIKKGSELFRAEHIADRRGQKEELKKEWLAALEFFLSRVFFQRFRDEINQRYFKGAIQGIKEIFPADSDSNKQILFGLQNDGWLNKLDDLDNPIRFHLKKYGVLDRARMSRIKLVISTLNHLTKTEINIVNWVLLEIQKGKSLKWVCEYLYKNQKTKIFGIGFKTASFFLRDFVSIFDIEVEGEDFFSVQPVDVHVEETAIKLELLPSRGMDKNIIVKKIIEFCCQNDISPIVFNEGAYYWHKHHQF
jgi:hypothetical protein